MLKNNSSNKFYLKVELEINTFNSESDHEIIVSINNEKIFDKILSKNKEHPLKIIDHFDFKEPGYNILRIKWNGEKECENKFMKVMKVIINDQHIPVYNALIDPIENEYLKLLKSSKQGMQNYRKSLLYAGHRHGWYGEYGFKFIIDPQLYNHNTEESLINSMGIRAVRIYTDKEQFKFYRKANAS